LFRPSFIDPKRCGGLLWRWGYGYLDNVAFVVGAPGYLDSFVRVSQAAAIVCGVCWVIGRPRPKLRDCARPWRATKARDEGALFP
jgi:hypothetical protein